MHTDLGLEDKYGAQLSLTWRADGGATLAVDDGYEDLSSRVELDGDGLLKIVATILCGLSNTGETANRIIEACRVGDGPIPEPRPAFGDGAIAASPAL